MLQDEYIGSSPCPMEFQQLLFHGSPSDKELLIEDAINSKELVAEWKSMLDKYNELKERIEEL